MVSPLPESCLFTGGARLSIQGLYDLQYAERTRPDCRGRLRSGKDGSFDFRAVVPPPYPIPGDVRLSCLFMPFIQST